MKAAHPSASFLLTVLVAGRAAAEMLPAESLVSPGFFLPQPDESFRRARQEFTRDIIEYSNHRGQARLFSEAKNSVTSSQSSA